MLRHLMMEGSKEIAQRERASGKSSANLGETRRKACYACARWIVRVAICYEMNSGGQFANGQGRSLIVNDVGGGRIGNNEVERIIGVSRLHGYCLDSCFGGLLLKSVKA
jgi:hypothetical protein